MMIDLETVASATELVTADEVIKFEDVDGHENQITCRIELTVRRVAEVFYIHADLRGIFKTPCHRCLGPAEQRLEPSFDLVVKRAGSEPGGEEAPGDEDLIYLPSGENELTLDERISESLIVSIPIRVVCGDSCKGLCSGCGVNLNFEECRCVGQVDSRWEALHKLKDNESD